MKLGKKQKKNDFFKPCTAEILTNMIQILNLTNKFNEKVKNYEKNTLKLGFNYVCIKFVCS